MSKIKPKKLVRMHSLGISEDIADEINNDNLHHIVRKSNTGFKKGDLLKFHVMDEDRNVINNHPLNNKNYYITYVHNRHNWGLRDDCVLLGIRRL